MRLCRLFTAHRLLAKEWLGLESSPCSAGQVMPRVCGGLHLKGCLFLICTRVPHGPGMALSLPFCLLPSLTKPTPSLSPQPRPRTAPHFLSWGISATHCLPSSVFHPAASAIFWQRKSECIPLLLGTPPDLAVPTGQAQASCPGAGSSAQPGLSPSAALVPARGLPHALPAAASSQHWRGHGGGGGRLPTFPDCMTCLLGVGLTLNKKSR